MQLKQTKRKPLRAGKVQFLEKITPEQLFFKKITNKAGERIGYTWSLF